MGSQRYMNPYGGDYTGPGRKSQFDRYLFTLDVDMTTYLTYAMYSNGSGVPYIILIYSCDFYRVAKRLLRTPLLCF